jgi:16S rRNA A1518/A1519 N6-dimethyltransferase RsmA/KsgA/DIM1 with predicted DNA glycosylase/AP lyase activity
LESKTHFVSTTHCFRRLAKTLPLRTDTVLEIGSSFGHTTEILAKRAKEVHGIEHSKVMIDALNTRFSNNSHVVVHWHDARDIYGIKEIIPKIDLLFFDIGGDAPAHIAVYLSQLYINTYRPRVVVVRNISLAAMLQEVVLTEYPNADRRYHKYRNVPSQEQIIEHYRDQAKRSDRKFIEREDKRRKKSLDLDRSL